MRTNDQVRTETRRKSSLREIESMKEKRTSQLYTSFRAARNRITKLAEEDSEHIEADWREQGTSGLLGVRVIPA